MPRRRMSRIRATKDGAVLLYYSSNKGLCPAGEWGSLTGLLADLAAQRDAALVESVRGGAFRLAIIESRIRAAQKCREALYNGKRQHTVPCD